VSIGTHNVGVNMNVNKQVRYQRFGEELKRLRQAQGISTHTELAKLIGVAQQTVTRWEAGESRPRAEQVALLAKALRADPQRLLIVAGHVTEQVTVSFDQPLPLASLSPEGFQRICRTLLEAIYPGAKVHAAGKTGHEQFGIDIDVELKSGEVHSFQCKREAKFGAARVKAAVEAHKTEAAQKFILLSRVASPLARREMKKHRGWDIWDQDDLSEKLRELPVDAKRRVIDTYFPGQRFALLGEPSPGPWLTPKDFFAPLVVADRPFSHHWGLIGRTKECALLAAALEDRKQVIVSLVGPAGGGKSRTLRAAIDTFTQEHSGHTILILSPTEQITMKSLEDLGLGEKLLVVDDAHDRTDLELLVRYAASPHTNARLLLVYRPYAQEVIDRQLAHYGLMSASVTLDRPTKAEAVELATHVLESLGGPVHAATLIADVAYDSPLSVVVGAWIVAKDGLHPELFGSHEVFQRTVLHLYKAAIAKSVSNSAKDQDLIERMLRVIALIQPVVPDDPKVLALYESIEGVNAPDATRLTKLLITSGVLFKRGARYRLSPDLLADSIIESGCIIESGASNGQAERVFEAAIPEHKAHLLLNLGRLDWRRNEGDTSDSPLLDALWRSLKWEGDYVRAHLKAAVEAAYFQPCQALAFARRLIEEGHGAHDDVCRLIRNAAYNLRYLRDASELLWELGRDDQRPTNQYTNHPLRLLTEMATPEPRVPIAYIEGVLDFMLSLVPYEDSWTGAFTLFDVLEGALATEGHFTSKATSRAFTLSSYGVNLEAVQSARQRIIDAILDSLTSDNSRRAYAAAETLQNALRGPIGAMNRKTSDEENADWEKEFTDTLERVNSLIERHPLSPVVLTRIAESVGWHAHYADGATTKEPAERILHQLDRDLITRTTRVLMDGWGTSTWKHRPDRQDHIGEIQAKLVEELDQAFPDAKALESFINERLIDLKAYRRESPQSTEIFVNRLLSDRPALARVVLDTRAESPDSPIAEFASVALAVLIKHAPGEADAQIEALLAFGDTELSLVARAYTMGSVKHRGLTESDRSILKRIFGSSDPAVLACTSWLFRDVAECDKRFAIDLLTNANPALATESRQSIFMWFDDDKLIPLDSLSEDELRQILQLFASSLRLDDHFVHAFLVRTAKRSPRLVVDLIKERLTQAVQRDDWRMEPIGGIAERQPCLDILDHPDGPVLLREVLDWALPRIDESRFAHHLSDLVLGVFGLQHSTCTSILEAWCADRKSERFKVLANVLREAPPLFVFEDSAFVARILKAARSLGASVYRGLGSSLFASAVSGVKGGAPGEPFPEDLRMKAQAEEVLATLSKADPAFALYDDIRKHAESNIERSLAEGRAMTEEDIDE